MFSAEYSYALELEASKEDGIREGIEIGREKGIEEGREEGREEGIYTKAIETAKALIEMGMSSENIVKATGLSIEEIAKL